MKNLDRFFGFMFALPPLVEQPYFRRVETNPAFLFFCGPAHSRFLFLTPAHADGVLGKIFVRRNQRRAGHFGLSDQHTIERIAVKGGKPG